jgi:hypothetical protein
LTEPKKLASCTFPIVDYQPLAATRVVPHVLVWPIDRPDRQVVSGGHRRVREAVNQKIRQHPLWFDWCLLVHDQPRQSAAAERRPRRDQMWWGRYNDLVAYIADGDGVRSRRDDSLHATGLHYWLVVQGQAFDAGTVSAEQCEALEVLGEWKFRRNEDPQERWNRRLEELRQFVTARGRFSTYDLVKRPAERVLAV